MTKYTQAICKEEKYVSKKDFVNKKIILHGTKEECANSLAKVKKLVGDKMVVEDMADACFMNSQIYILSLDMKTA